MLPCKILNNENRNTVMKKIHKISAILALGGLLSFSAIAHNTATLEPLYGLTMHQNSITVIVKSNGCTKAEHFTVDQLQASDYTQINVMRQKPDRCRAMSRLMMVTLALKDNAKDSYRINNGFVLSGDLKKL